MVRLSSERLGFELGMTAEDRNQWMYMVSNEKIYLKDVWPQKKE